MAGFEYEKRLSGGAPTIEWLTFKDTETLTKGDLVNLETGEIDLAATADTNLLGVILETKAGVDSTTKARVITDDDAVYAVTDANARVKGATLDIAGATGAQGVAASTNKELVVVSDSTATERTRVRINVGKHHNNKAQ
jgi:hypothetical protein